MTCKNCECDACKAAREAEKQKFVDIARGIYDNHNRPSAAGAIKDMVDGGELETGELEQVFDALEEVAGSLGDTTFAEHVQEIHYHFYN